MGQEDGVAKLAKAIDATQKAERLLASAEQVEKLRREGACELYRICAEFTASVNGRLREAILELAPPEYSAEAFREPGANLIQISSQGRQMQIAFEATQGLASTEKFGIPYVLEGEVRTYNQRMLERFEVRSRMIFFCVEGEQALWRAYDWRTRSTGALTGETLVGLMGPLF